MFASKNGHENVVKLLHLGEFDDLIAEVRLKSAADAAVLHPNHRLLALDQVCVVDQVLVNVQLRHVVDDDGALEVLVVMLGLEDVLEQGGLARPEEAAEQGDGNQAVILSRCCLWKQIS